jgi:hypothetical protein
MAILTRAELDQYPGTTPTERELAHFGEAAPKRLKLGERVGAKLVPSRSDVPSPLDTLPACVDLRPFPGRDRTERVMAWLIAHVPRASAWSAESLREVALGVVGSRQLLE